MTAKVTVVRHIAALYPCVERREAPLLDAWIAFADGRITAVGAEPCPITDAAEEIDGRGCLGIPGLINMHHHFFQSVTRVVPSGQNKDAVPWLRAMYPLWQELDPDALHVASQLAVAELLLTGATTSLDHAYLYPAGQVDLIDHEIAAVKPLGIRFHAIRACSTRLEGAIEAELAADPRLSSVRLTEDPADSLAAMRRAFERHHDPAPFSMQRIGIGPTQIPYNHPEFLQQLIDLARAQDCDRHVHLTPLPADLALCEERYGCRPTEYLRRIGWLAPKSVLAHCTRHTAADIASLAASGGGMVHCPSQNMRLGTPVGPIPEMLAGGVPVAIGVDGAASNDGGSMLGELRLVLMVHRLMGTHDDYAPGGWMEPHDVLWMATRHAASLLGRDELGQIAPGKAADIVLINLRQIGYAGALHDPLAAVLMCGDTATVERSIVAGRTLVEGGALKDWSHGRLIDEGNRVAARMIADAERRTGERFGSLAPRLADLV